MQWYADAGVEVIDGHPVEFVVRIAVHDIHQVGHEGFEVVHARSVLWCDDQTELIGVGPLAFEKSSAASGGPIHDAFYLPGNDIEQGPCSRPRQSATFRPLVEYLQASTAQGQTVLNDPERSYCPTAPSVAPK